LVVLALAACQGPIGRSVGPDTPSIGDLAAVTHETRLTLSGTKSVNSSLFIDGEEVVARDTLTTWAVVVALPQEGTNTFEIKALDDRGQISRSLFVSVVLDTILPAAPTVTVTLPTTTNPVELTGTKEAGSLVRLDGRVIVPASNATAWTYQATVAGTNPKTLTFTAVDAAGNESTPTPVLVTLTTSCAAPHLVFPLDRRAIVWGAAFEWEALSPQPLGGYRFQLSASPAFDTSTLIVDAQNLSVMSYVPANPAPARGVYFWRVGAEESGCISYGVTRMVRIGSTTGDINGDGTADLLIGVVGDDTAAKDAGAAYGYYGGSSPEVQADMILTGENRLDAFGTAVAKVGDIDGDGYEDVLVGAYLFDRDADRNDNVGRAYLFWGGPTPSTVPALVFTGDNANDQFGLSVAGVGDINGDGYPDVAVGAYRATVTAACGGGTSRLPGIGRVYVYFGGPRATTGAKDAMDAKADAVLTGESTLFPGNPLSACRQDEEFGGSVAGAGDINGDGYDDLVVGAREKTTPASKTGRAYVFYGGPWFVGVGADRANAIFTGSATGDEFGEAVAGAGDTNGDGFADVVIGAPLRDGATSNTGSAYWYFGSPTLSSASLPAFILNGVSAEDNFGFSVSSAGDVNRDGYTDMVVGAFLADAGGQDNGSATLYLGGASPSSAPAATYTGETALQSDDEFGISVSGAGDVNLDGYDDVIVGAYHNDACCGVTTGGDGGRAYLFIGEPLPTSRPAAANLTDWVITGPGPGDGLGISVR
jgi:hypothetical protein